MQSYKKIRYARHGEGERIVEREFLTADIQCIESICTVGAVLDEVFFRRLRKRQADDFTLGKFLAAFVLAKTVPLIPVTALERYLLAVDRKDTTAYDFDARYARYARYAQ